MRLTIRTTISIDDDLLAAAQKSTGIQEKSALVKAGLRALIEREAAIRLSQLGGSEPNAEYIPRRRSSL